MSADAPTVYVDSLAPQPEELCVPESMPPFAPLGRRDTRVETGLSEVPAWFSINQSSREFYDIVTRPPVPTRGFVVFSSPSTSREMEEILAINEDDCSHTKNTRPWCLRLCRHLSDGEEYLYSNIACARLMRFE